MPAMTSIDEARIQQPSWYHDDDDGNVDVDDSSLVEQASGSGGRRHKLFVATSSFVRRDEGNE